MYGAVKFNYHANMMKENFTHFHAIPRYDKIINKYGVEWIDEEYPSKAAMSFKTVVEESVLQEIKQDFIREIN